MKYKNIKGLSLKPSQNSFGISRDPQTAKKILEKKNKVGGLAPLDSKFIVTVIN